MRWCTQLVRLKGFQELTPIPKALDQFFKRLQPNRIDPVFVPLSEALGRVTARNLIAEENIPPFNRSAVDGYAAKAKDTIGVTQFKPRTLCLVKNEIVGEGEAREIWTGNPIPKGTDSVIMLEHVRKTDDEIEVLVSLTPGENVSRKGEDVKKGDIVVEEGVRLNPHHLGLLASLGTKRVDVIRKPRVAILATGNELIALGEKPGLYKVVEVNSIILANMCAEMNVEAFSLGIAKDDENEIENKIYEGLTRADIMITTGGTSVGVHDLVPKVIEKMENDGVVVHGIAMRPGMPTALAVIQNKPLLILSGNPVAATVGFEVFARPLIHKLTGAKNEMRTKLKARLTRRVAGVLGQSVFLRVNVMEEDGELFAEPIRVKGSSIITTITKANGYVIIPENREGLKENERVTVHLFDTVKKV